jgi:hypothetical protein
MNRETPPLGPISDQSTYQNLGCVSSLAEAILRVKLEGLVRQNSK